MSNCYTTIKMLCDFYATPGLLVFFFQITNKYYCHLMKWRAIFFHTGCTVYTCQASSVDLALLLFLTTGYETTQVWSLTLIKVNVCLSLDSTVVWITYYICFCKLVFRILTKSQVYKGNYFPF